METTRFKELWREYLDANLDVQWDEWLVSKIESLEAGGSKMRTLLEWCDYWNITVIMGIDIREAVQKTSEMLQAGHLASYTKKEYTGYEAVRRLISFAVIGASKREQDRFHHKFKQLFDIYD